FGKQAEVTQLPGVVGHARLHLAADRMVDGDQDQVGVGVDANLPGRNVRRQRRFKGAQSPGGDRRGFGVDGRRLAVEFYHAKSDVVSGWKIDFTGENAGDHPDFARRQISNGSGSNHLWKPPSSKFLFSLWRVAATGKDKI